MTVTLTQTSPAPATPPDAFGGGGGGGRRARQVAAAGSPRSRRPPTRSTFNAVAAAAAGPARPPTADRAAAAAAALACAGDDFEQALIALSYSSSLEGGERLDAAALMEAYQPLARAIRAAVAAVAAAPAAFDAPAGLQVADALSALFVHLVTLAGLLEEDALPPATLAAVVAAGRAPLEARRRSPPRTRGAPTRTPSLPG